jgi:hypothetical protein
MKRLVACLAVAGLLIGALCAPAMALGLLAQPSDGQKVALTNWSPVIYEYPAGSGAWYLDGFTGNYTTDVGPIYYGPTGSSVTLVDPHVTVEYRTAADAVLSRETFAVDANVIHAYGATGHPASYRTFHHRLTLPAGASALRTRLAPEVATSDPEFPKYHFATANRSAVFQEINASWGTIDATTLGGGRIQRTLTVTNNTGQLVGPIRIAGRESYGPSSAMLDSYDVTPNDPAKALLLGNGESTTFTLRGLAVAPVSPRDPANSWIEAEPPSLIGTVTWAGTPLTGVTVTPSGNYTPTRTIFNGQYAKTGVVGLLAGNGITYSKPGYDTQSRSVTIGGGATTTQDIALTVTPSIARSPKSSSVTYRRKKGKAKYSLSATVKGADSTPVGGIRVRLQRSVNGKTKWKTSGTYTANSAGKVTKAFTSKNRSTTYYRWVVLPQSGVTATPKTSRQKIRIK